MKAKTVKNVNTVEKVKTHNYDNYNYKHNRKIEHTQANEQRFLCK